MDRHISAFINDVMTGVTNCSLYSERHFAVGEAARDAMSQVPPLLDERTGSLGIMSPRGNLIINSKPVKDRSAFVANFVKRLRRKGIEKVVIRDGVSEEELLRLIVFLAGNEPRLEPLANISVGILEVRKAEAGDPDVQGVLRQNVEHLDSIQDDFKSTGSLDSSALEDVVINFISTIQRESNVLKLLMPIKEHNEYTFAHSANVTILSLFQAETLGFKGEILREIGMAALLHDMGKMFVSKEVIEKPGKLEPQEWEEMKKHPTYGARYLSTQPQVAPMAIIGAYEHHMKFDGTGYPETIRRGRTQHIISQVITCSDFFDALRTERPYRKPLDVGVVLGMMLESRGRDFNPLLVDHFVEQLRRVGAYE